MNALLILIQEPITDPMCSADSGLTPVHYQAMLEVLLQQLEGLRNTHVRFCYQPADAGEALQFFLLPLLRGEIIKRPNDFLFTPSKNAPAITLDFHALNLGCLGKAIEAATADCFSQGYEKVAIIGSDTPDCGSRWINAAMLQTKPELSALGTSTLGFPYFFSSQSPHPGLHLSTPAPSHCCSLPLNADAIGNNTFSLPPLQQILTIEDWERAMDSAIGGKLKAAYKRQKDNT